MASHHHDVSQDKGAAFTGLFAGMVLLAAFISGMVHWTNSRHHAEGGEKAAVEAHK